MEKGQGPKERGRRVDRRAVMAVDRRWGVVGEDSRSGGDVPGGAVRVLVMRFGRKGATLVAVIAPCPLRLVQLAFDHEHREHHYRGNNCYAHSRIPLQLSRLPRNLPLRAAKMNTSVLSPPKTSSATALTYTPEHRKTLHPHQLPLAQRPATANRLLPSRPPKAHPPTPSLLALLHTPDSTAGGLSTALQIAHRSQGRREEHQCAVLAVG